MRPKLLKLLLLLGLIVSLTSVGFAEEGTAGGANAAPLSSAEMMTQAEAVVENGVALSTTVAGLLREATDEADMMKVSCLKDKETKINGDLGTAQQHLATLRKATDAGVRSQEHTMIMVIGQRLEVLSREASQCVGQDLFETGETTVDTVKDPTKLGYEKDPSVRPMILPPSLPTLPPPESGMR